MDLRIEAVSVTYPGGVQALGDVVVILSTHIVEDVAATCSRMAILSQGTVLYCGEPDAAVATLGGRVSARSLRGSPRTARPSTCSPPCVEWRLRATRDCSATGRPRPAAP
jgi:hypothetical protein